MLQEDGGEAVMVVVGFGDEVGGLFDIVLGIGHSDADGSSLEHGNIVGFVPGCHGVGERNM